MEVSTAITKRRQKRVYFRDATRGGKAATLLHRSLHDGLSQSAAKPVEASPAWPCGSAFLAGSRPVLAESAKSNRYNAMSRPERTLCRRYLLRSRKLVFSLPQHSARTWCRLVSWPMCEPEGADTKCPPGEAVCQCGSLANYRSSHADTFIHDSPFPLATASSFSRKKYSSLNSYL